MKGNPTAIIVGDIHYRDDQPRCRLDDFWETQKRKALWLKDLWEETGRPPVLQPGDLFHTWKSSPRVINAVLEYLPPMITMPGNPGKHNWTLDRDALGVLSHVEGWEVLANGGPPGLEFGDEFALTYLLWGESQRTMVERLGCLNDMVGNPRSLVLMEHVDISARQTAFGSLSPKEYVSKRITCNLYVTGHNHKPVVSAIGDGSWLVNPGSFTRQSASETHKPVVYLWHASVNSLEAVHVPCDSEAVSRDHIDEKTAREDRMQAFVGALTESGMINISISFRDNVLKQLSASSDTMSEAAYNLVLSILNKEVE